MLSGHTEKCVGRFFSCYFGLSSSVTHFERSFFTFLRSFWTKTRLTMQLRTMDGDVPDMMMALLVLGSVRFIGGCLFSACIFLATTEVRQFS
jgi:hypothetical protein